jgi:DNA-binding transcriptional LysR family regulator
MALKRLEEFVEARLCHRGPGGFALTHEGEAIAEVCENLFGTVSGISATLADNTEIVRGRIRIQMISNLVNSRLDAALSSFHHSYTDVEVYIGVATWNIIKHNVLRNDAELGISTTAERDPNLRYDPLFREIYRPYCGRAHPMYGKVVERPAELARHAFILTGTDEPDTLRRYRQRYRLGQKIAGL